MAENQSLKASKTEEEEEEEEEADGKAEKPLILPLISQPNRSSSVKTPSEEGSTRRSVPETLTLASSIPVRRNKRDSSHCMCLSLPLANSGQSGMSHQEALASVTAQAQMKLQAAHSSSSTKLPVNSLIPSVSPAFNPISQQQKREPVLEDNLSTPETEQHPSSDQKSQSTHVVAKSSSGDCYNWQKYGEKQVKGIECSRSYYRCSDANCHVRKHVVCCYSGHVIEIMYKGRHNHDPPQKIRCTKESRVPSGEPFEETANLLGGKNNGSSSPAPRREQPSGLATFEQQLHYPTNHGGVTGIRINEEHDDEPEPKRRMAYSTLLLKTTGKPKVVVQKSSDLGTLGDGYRWRKYGQKLVKGNPNPRSYYRCTYDGCAVRKHVERASDDAKALVITYEGKHNHEPPALKKDDAKALVMTHEGKHNHEPPPFKKDDANGRLSSKNSTDSHDTTLLIAAAAAITAGGQSTTLRGPMAQFPSDREDKVSEKALELGGEKALESAQTLLSIGFNLNSSEAEGGAKNPHVIEQPLLDGNHAVASV